jgi:hypothetical protein
MLKLSPSEIISFWSKVQCRDADECWLWIGGRSGGQRLGGYGVFAISRKHNIKNRNRYAHRVSFCIGRGYPISYLNAGVEVRHTCHKHLCCNPTHLEVGSHADNVQDTVSANRQARGSRVAGSILIESDIPKIRELLGTTTHKEIAQQFGVARATISLIASGKNWRWVTR